MPQIEAAAEVIEEMKPLEVELPVCDVCSHIGKHAHYQGRMRSYCMGAKGEQHKKAPMRPRTFREVVE